MALSQIDLYQGALLLLKEEKLASLMENREPRFRLDEIWNEGNGNGQNVINGCLQDGQWVFAKRTVQLNYDQSITPSFGHSYACDKPTDYVRMMELATDEFFNEPLNDFNENQKYFLTNYQILYLKYVSNDPSWGGNLASWPPSFIDYVKAYMAEKIAGRLTGSKVDAKEMQDTKMRILSHAQGIDAIERPTAFPPTGTWIRSRRGIRGNYSPFPPKA